MLELGFPPELSPALPLVVLPVFPPTVPPALPPELLPELPPAVPLPVPAPALPVLLPVAPPPPELPLLPPPLPEPPPAAGPPLERPSEAPPELLLAVSRPPSPEFVQLASPVAGLNQPSLYGQLCSSSGAGGTMAPRLPRISRGVGAALPRRPVKAVSTSD